ncbi:MAG: 3',5'-cyclic-AMP phosphodiesterase [Pseudomonadota bacterium]
MARDASRPLRVVQFSDSHLFASTDGKLLGLNTDDSLDRVFDLIEKEQSAMDVILATGDLSQDASLASYRRLVEKLKRFKAPSYWLEGNHDLTAPMRESLGNAAMMCPCVIKQGNWSIIMLDSTIPYAVPGELDAGDLAFLEKSLQAAQGRHVMVCLHHHPISLDCQWLDTQVVSSADKFFEIIDRYDNVRAIIWGHVHQEYAGKRNNVNLYAVPSTCVQFKPLSNDFAIDDTAPGYRWFDLHADGRIDTGVSRVVGIEFEVDFSVKGY